MIDKWKQIFTRKRNSLVGAVGFPLSLPSIAAASALGSCCLLAILFDWLDAAPENYLDQHPLETNVICGKDELP